MLYLLVTRRRYVVFVGCQEKICCICWSPGEDMLYLLVARRRYVVFVGTRRRYVVFVGHQEKICCICWSPGEDMLYLLVTRRRWVCTREQCMRHTAATWTSCYLCVKPGRTTCGLTCASWWTLDWSRRFASTQHSQNSGRNCQTDTGTTGECLAVWSRGPTGSLGGAGTQLRRVT